MIAAHGATLNITDSSIYIHRSSLSAALHGEDVDGNNVAAGAVDEVAVDTITDVESQAPSALDSGWVDLGGSDVRIWFSPNQQIEMERFVDDVEAARRGEAPASDSVAGLNFVALDVETANQDWASICQIGVVKIIDGVPAESESWLCQPPESASAFDPVNVGIHGITAADVADAPAFAERVPALQDFVGELPILAHNAQFDATALRRASQASKVAVAETPFGCSLALSRHSDVRDLKLANHKLPTVAEALGVELSKHHDALADAKAAAGIVVALARRARHQGSLMDLFHSIGFTLGVLSEDRVIPVLLDRSGAGRSAQAGAGPEAVGEAVDEATGTAETSAPVEQPQGKKDAQNNGPAPWQSVATPDEIPEPNAAADPDDPLNGQHVTLTGDFSPHGKGELWTGIANHGGQVGKSVTKKTTVLVTGAWAQKTSKEKRAEELIEKGQELEIWPADKLLEMLGLDEQPPF